MDYRKTKNRNREIFARFKTGQTAESLGKRYGLTVKRIRVVLIDERHRQDLSPEYFYRAQRSAGLSD
jgi:Mor family transcriptional regulator